MRSANDARFELSAPVPFSLVCFRYRGSDDENRALLERSTRPEGVSFGHRD